MITVVLVIHLLIALALVTVVLLQRSEGGALGIGGGAGGLVSARGAANLLTRLTSILAGAFFATSILLTILGTQQRAAPSILEQTAPAGPVVPLGGDQSAPSGPAVPLGGGGAGQPSGTGGGLLQELQPKAPEAPRGPVVPQSQ